MYVSTAHNEVNTAQLTADFDLLLVNKTAVANVTVNFISWENLKKSNTERISRIYTKIFGEAVFNPYEERFEMMITINNWMQKQIVKAINALCGICEETAYGISFFANVDRFAEMLVEIEKYSTQVTAKRVIEDTIVETVTALLAQGFTCASIGNMGLGVSAKQASRIKRGRRYSDVSGVEEVKPVARQTREVDQIFA